jgi:hypothetical protein
LVKKNLDRSTIRYYVIHGFFPLQWAETLNSDNLFAVPMAVFFCGALFFIEIGGISLVVFQLNPE